jgi:hypothetical protein
MDQTFARVGACFKEKSSGLRSARGGLIFAESLDRRVEERKGYEAA